MYHYQLAIALRQISQGIDSHCSNSWSASVSEGFLPTWHHEGQVKLVQILGQICMTVLKW